MSTEQLLFYYERTRTQQAKVLILNMMLLPLVIGLWLMLIPTTEEGYPQFLQAALYIVAGAELGLFAVAVWFLAYPAKYFIRLTHDEFCSVHPTVKAWTFSVKPQDITEIVHSTDRDASASYLTIHMKDGSSCLLSPNFSYNRQQLYAALRLLNSDLKLPKHPGLFSFRE